GRALPRDRRRGRGGPPGRRRGAGAQRPWHPHPGACRWRDPGVRLDRGPARRIRGRAPAARARRARFRRRARRAGLARTRSERGPAGRRGRRCQRHGREPRGAQRMSFDRLMLRTWSENRLFSALVELTYRCNLDCFFCYNDLALRGRPLSLEQYFDFFADLRDLQVLNLTLTGGEPLAHPDFLRLGARARELGFVVRIKSNGHALRGALARRIRDEIDPFLVEVSLHGATAAVHDRQTREPGSFERLLANLREMRGLGLRVKLNSTLTA